MPVESWNADKFTPRFIVVEGPIGVGKTSLAKRLADAFGGDLVLERNEKNPFLADFYQSGGRSALPAQLFFLFERARQIESLRQADLFSPVRIADFHILKDRLFAEMNLCREELALYEQISSKLELDVPEPDLVIYLQASVDVLMSRIARRGREYERNIDRAYLERVANAYARQFYDYDAGPLLIVNVSAIDPIGNDADFEALFDQVRRVSSGRHFFNPASAVAFA